MLVEEDPEEVLVPEPDDEAPEEVEELPLPELLEPDVEAGGATSKGKYFRNLS